MAKWAGLQQFKIVKTSGKHVKEIVLWDQISNCRGTDCSVYNECTFIKAGKCSLESEYIEALCKMIYGLEREEKLTNATMFIAGLKIVPLYQHLFKFKLLEIRVANDNQMVLGVGGKTKIHPVYKEMRDTINTIVKVWKEIGILDKENMPMPEINVTNAVGSYYEAMNLDDAETPEQ